MYKNVMNDLESYFYSNPKFNSRIPMYNDDSDYTTNAPSYYDDLARKNKLMKTLALRIWEYEKEMIRRLQQWDKNLEDFPEDVKELLEKWLEDGTLDHIINDTIFNWKADKTYVDDELYKKVDKNSLVVNVMDHGAKGDGETNDKTAIERAGQICKDNKQTLFLPPDKHFYINGDLDLSGVMFIDSPGVITFENNQNAILLQNNSEKADYKEITFGDVFGRIEIRGFKNAHIRIGYARELLLYADGDIRDINSIAYNSFYLGRVDTINIDSDNLGGWINENKFFGGRFNVIKIGGDYPHNHNIFYAPTLENTTETQRVEINRGSSNMILNSRWEGSGSKVIFDERTWDNLIERSWSGAPGGYSQGSYRFSDVVDKGTGNTVAHTLDKYNVHNDLLTITPETENFNTDNFIKTGNNLQKTFDSIYSRVFDSGIFEVNESFSFGYSSDSTSWRMGVMLYDSTGNQITLDSVRDDSIISFTMSNNYTGSVIQPINRNAGWFHYKKHPDVKYIQIYIQSFTEERFKFFNTYYSKHTFSKLNIPVKSNIQGLTGSKPPTDGEWETGTFIRNIKTDVNKPSGWTLTESGEWLPVGTVAQLNNYKSGMFTKISDGVERFNTISHNLGDVPEKFNVVSANDETGIVGINYINVNNSNIIVYLSKALPEGQEVKLNWWAERRG